MADRYDLMRGYLRDSGAGESLTRLLTALIAEAEAHEQTLQQPNGTRVYRCSTSEREWYAVRVSEEDLADESIFVQAGTWQPGDACASCGSRETGYDVTDGATCNGCGRTDADA